MILSKMKLLGTAVVASAVIVSVALACGAAPNPSIRSQWEREGLPN